MHYANSSLPDDAHANSGGPAGSGSCDPSVTDECVDFSHSEIHATTFLVDYPASVWFNGAFPTSAMTRPVQNRPCRRPAPLLVRRSLLLRGAGRLAPLRRVQ